MNKSKYSKKQNNDDSSNNSWKPCMAMESMITGERYYLYLPNEAIACITSLGRGNKLVADFFAMAEHAMSILEKKDPNNMDFVVLKWNGTPYGDLTCAVGARDNVFDKAA